MIQGSYCIVYWLIEALFGNLPIHVIRLSSSMNRVSFGRLKCEQERDALTRVCRTTTAYTGHFSSFHAMSQNIHSYRELMMKDSSIRRFSSLPAVLAH